MFATPVAAIPRALISQEKTPATAGAQSHEIGSIRSGLPRPGHALVAGGDAAHALVDELLQALSFVGLGRVDVALGVGRDAVHAVELARLAAAVAERGELLQRLAQDDAHAVRSARPP